MKKNSDTPGGMEYTTDGIAYKRMDEYPNRPTIIFLHDSLGCIKMWGDFPKKLGELTHCNVIIYDRPGYGMSPSFTSTQRDKNYMEREADVLRRLLDSWGLENALLYGHSDGGSIALITAGKYPSKISGAITEGAHVFVENITVKGVRNTVELYNTTGLKDKLKIYHSDKTEDMFQAWAKTWTSEWFRDWNIENYLPRIKCPVLVIQGEKDGYGTMLQVNKIMEGTGGLGSKLVVKGAKHSPHKETPEMILENCVKFINGIVGD